MIDLPLQIGIDWEASESCDSLDCVLVHLPYGDIKKNGEKKLYIYFSVSE